MITNKKIYHILHLALAAVLLLSACALPGSTGETDLTVEGRDSTPAASSPDLDSTALQLECEIEGYPCTYAETDPQVLEDSITALDQAALALDEGESMQDAADFLQKNPDLAELIYNTGALRFRLENGPPFWLFHSAGLAQNTKGTGGTSKFSLTSSQPSSELFQFDFSDLGIIGFSERGEEPKKKALILSAFDWEFGPEETDNLRDKIARQRNYDCPDCLNYLKNTILPKNQDQDPDIYELRKLESLQMDISITDYMTWDDYDLIHLSTHGSQICVETLENCQSGLMTGRFTVKEEWSREGGDGFDVPGVVWSRTAAPGCNALEYARNNNDLSDEEWEENYEEWKEKGCPTYTKRWWQIIEPSFFTHHYTNLGKQLDDKLIFFSACQSMKDDSFVRAIEGENTTIMGWTENVEASNAVKVSSEFYKYYITQALEADQAVEKVKENLGDSFQVSALDTSTIKGIEIDSLIPPDFLQKGEDKTRGREIITLLQPIFKTELEERDAVPTVGAAGDGQPDKMLFLVQTDGISQDQNPEEFVIHFSVDGQDLEGDYRPMEKISEFSYWTLAEVPLPFDAAERDFVELEAWVELPSGGISRHVIEEVELANCGWNLTLSGSSSGEYSGDIVFPTANLSNANTDQLLRLAEEGYLGPGESGAGMPSPEELTGLPDSYLLGSQQQYPFLMMIPGQGLTTMLEANSLGIGNQISLNLSEDTAERKTGSYSGSFTDLLTQGSFSIQGDLIWHQDSICSLDVILELAENPYPESLTP